MLRIDQRKGDKGPAVLGPARQHRQAIEPDVRRDHFAHRAGRDPLRADLEQIEANVAGAPELRRRRRQQRFSQVHEALDEGERPRAERQLGATRGAEQVGDERKIRALHVREQQRRPAGGDHAPMNLRGFEVGIDRRADFNELPIAAKLIEEGAEIAEDLP